MIKKEDVTIVIPHLGSSEEQEYSLTQCKLSLEETAPEIEVVVAKNGGIDCIHPAHVKVDAQGQCKATNAAVATINTDWIIVTNDDMVFPPGWFERLVDGLDETKHLCVSPKLIEPGAGAPTFEKFFCGGAGGDFDRDKFYKFADEEYYKRDGLELRTGFNLPFLIRRDLWNLVGGYDINYDPWGSNSDSDLEYKIRLAGIQPMQNTKSIAYHFSQTSGTFHPKNRSYWSKNFAYFQEKWGFPRTDQRIWEADFEMPDKERIYRPPWENYYK